MSFAKKVNAVINRKAETKSHITVGTEVSSSSLTSPVFGTTICTLNNVPAGGAVNQRTGNKISPSYLNVRGFLHLAADAASQFIKLMIVEHDEIDNFATDGLETDLATYAPPGSDLGAINGRINTTRYRVLKTKIVKLGHTQGFFGSAMFNFDVKLKGNMYFEQAGTIPSRRKLSFIFYNRRADNDETLGTTCEVTYNSKFYYTDM